MITLGKVNLSVFQTGWIYSRVVTFLSQGPHLLFLELHETNAAVFYRSSHQTELKLYPAVFELPASFNLDWAHKWDICRVVGTAVRSCRTRSLTLSNHFRKWDRLLCNVL